MVDEVLDPGIVRVAGRWDAVLPAGIVLEPLAAPVLHVERRVGKDEVGFQVWVQVAVEAVRILGAEVALDPPDGKVHVRQFPRGRV